MSNPFNLVAPAPTVSDYVGSVPRPESRGSSNTLWQIGHLLVDDIALHERVGEGGMGIVYRAQHLVTQQEYAVKRVHPSRLPSDRAAQRRFYMELVTWSDAPKHPSLLACLFFRTIGSELAIFSEFMPRGNLFARISRTDPLPLNAVLRTAADIASGVVALHERSLIHQDIKPANILFDSADVARLSDFGLARASAQTDPETPHSAPLVTCGGMTRAYCSPEQARGARLTTRTDVFSWAVTLVHALLGRVEWASGADLAIGGTHLLARARGEPLPAALVQLLEQCLSQEPQCRPEMRSVHDRLVDIASGLGISWSIAPPAMVADRLTRAKAPFKSQLNAGRIMIGPLQWQIRERVDLGIESLDDSIGPSDTQAEVAHGIAEYIRIAAEYRAALPNRPELTWRFRCLLVETALAQEEAGDLQASLASAREAAELSAPESGEDADRRRFAMRLAARVLKASGRFREAISLLQPVAEANSTDGEHERCRVLLELGFLYLDLGASSQAMGWYKKALDCASTIGNPLLQEMLSIESRYEIANACRVGGNEVAALREVNVAIAQVGRFREQLAQATGLERALYHPQGFLARSLWLRGVLLSKAGEHEEALRSYDRAVETAEELHESSDDGFLTTVKKSRSISLHAVGRISEAIAEIDSVITVREQWYSREGRSEFAFKLARAHAIKASMLGQMSELAYALYKRAFEKGCTEIVYEFASYMGRMGEILAQRGNNDAALKLLWPATGLLEKLVSNDLNAERASQRTATLVTRYLQLSRLTSHDAAASEALLDRSLMLARGLFRWGAPVGIVAHFIEAATDKFAFLNRRDDRPGREAVLTEAESIYRNLARFNPLTADSAAALSGFLRVGGARALQYESEAPERALEIIDATLAEVPDSGQLSSEVLHRYALALLVRARICRSNTREEIGPSVDRALRAWSAMFASVDQDMLEKAFFFLGEHIAWCERTGNYGLAKRAVQSMGQLLSAAAAESGCTDFLSVAATWRDRYSRLLEAQEMGRRGNRTV